MDVVSLITNSILVLALVIVTYFYMRHTKRMADIMVMEYELKVSPFIEIELTYKSRGELDFTLFNRGTIPVDIDKVVFEWWFRGKKDKTWTIDLKIDEALTKEKPILKPLSYSINNMVKDEFPESKQMSPEQLYHSIEGKIYAFFWNIKKEIHRTREVKIPSLV